jgi:hypothetical protein
MSNYVGELNGEFMMKSLYSCYMKTVALFLRRSFFIMQRDSFPISTCFPLRNGVSNSMDSSQSFQSLMQRNLSGLTWNMVGNE